MKNIKIVLLILFTSIFLSTACNKNMDPNRPINAEEKRRKNIEEGRGASIGGLLGRTGATNYEFSSSNPMWSASLETLDFLPLTTVDYSGGVIITDWYSQDGNQDSIKLTVRFLSNEVRSDSLKIIVHNKKCKINENCTIREIDSKIKFELQKSILAKAVLIEQDSKKSKKN